MRLIHPSKLVTLLLLTFMANAAFAQLNLPNPLIEPAAKRKLAAPDGLPPPPPQAASESAPGGRPGSANDAQSEETKKNAMLSTDRNLFNGFTVAAIVGDQAILRRSGLAAGAGTGALPGGQMALPGATSATGAGAAANAPEQSFMVNNGEEFDLPGSDTSFVTKVKDGRVAIFKLIEGKDKKMKRVAMYVGELNSMPYVQKPIVLQIKDQDFTKRLTVKAGTDSSSASSSSAQGQNSPPPAPAQ